MESESAASNSQEFSKYYSDLGFIDKCIDFAKSAGGEIIVSGLRLYYDAQRPDTPTWAKSVIYGALGYFILPLDAIPDGIPLVGFTDDLGALAVATGTVAAFINEEVRLKAAAQFKEWFGSDPT